MYSQNKLASKGLPDKLYGKCSLSSSRRSKIHTVKTRFYEVTRDPKNHHFIKSNFIKSNFFKEMLYLLNKAVYATP
jgi:hypothetical protein